MRSHRATERQPSTRADERQPEGAWRRARGLPPVAAPPLPAVPLQVARPATALPAVGHTFGSLSLFPSVPAGGTPDGESASVQRLGGGASGVPVADLGARIRTAAGGGSALPADVQRRLETGLGANLSGVRVHTDGEADRLSRAVDAVAFTTGADIYFRGGAYQPATAGGLHLLAHEATHVVQQAAGPVAGTPAPGGVSISTPGDAFERAADGAATAVLQRTAASLSRSIPAGLATSATVVQRGPESQALLAKLATPRIFPGPEIAIQDRLVIALDTVIDETIRLYPPEMEALDKAIRKHGDDAEKQTIALASIPESEIDKRLAAEKAKGEANAEADRLFRQRRQMEVLLASFNDAIYIGAILLAKPIGGGVEELIQSSKLIDLPPKSAGRGVLAHSLSASAYPLVVKAGVADLVVRNTLRTMEDAGQLEYLRKSGLINDDFAVLVEVHYYRSRPTSRLKFHKDTTGQTLFVNLNFTNDEEIKGPEYVINPPSDAAYDDYVEKNLPKAFVEDWNAVKDDVPGQKHIHATTVKPKHVVAFVDEAIHHKTPTPGHRTASGDAIAKVLQGAYGDEYDDAARAYGEYKGASKLSLWPWQMYLKNTQARQNAFDWYVVMDKIATMKRGLQSENRDQLATSLPSYFHGDIDAIIEEGGSADFGSVSYFHVNKQTLTVPVKKPGERPLKRTMSMSDLSQYAVTSGAGKKRTFFRTWVRAVPRKDIKL